MNLISTKKLIAASALVLLFGTNFAQGYFTIALPEKKITGQIFNFNLNPGESETQKLKVTNKMDYPITLELYGIDATLTSTGKYALSLPSKPQRTLGKWTTVSESQITLEAKEQKLIPFTVKIPENTTPGSYAGGMVAEAKSVKPPDQEEKGLSNEEIEDSKTLPVTGVTSAVRMGMKMFVEVPGKKITKLDITEFKHHESNHFHNFDITLKNSGNTIIRAEPSLSITGFPSPNLTLEEQNVIVFQQEETRVPIRWEKVTLLGSAGNDKNSTGLTAIQKPFFGIFDAKLQVSYSVYDLASNTYSNPKSLEKSIRFIVIPWKAIIAIILIIMIIIGHKILRTHRIKKLKNRSVIYIVQPGDTLISIACNHKIKWKLMAEINDLEPPYSLAPGSQVLVPPISKPTPPATESTPLTQTTPPNSPPGSTSTTPPAAT